MLCVRVEKGEMRTQKKMGKQEGKQECADAVFALLSLKLGKALKTSLVL